MTASALGSGDLLPEIVVPPPGPASRRLGRSLAVHEAPRVNTLFGGRPSVVWQAARGCNVLDVDGNRYIDATSGFGAAAIGHAHPAVVDAVRKQSQHLVHGLADVAAHPARIELAERLVRLAPMPDAQVYFAVSGSDAVEIALKTAQLASGRSGVLALDDAYHGLSIGALAATARDAFRAPFADGLRPAVHRLTRGGPPSELDAVLDAHGGDIGCFLFEPVAGREGVRPAPPGWLRGIVDRCRERGILVIADEIFTGFGRTGTLWAVEPCGVEPDLVCCGKALGGGLPIAAVLGRRDLLVAWDGPGEAPHTGTFLANPLSCAAANAVLDVLEAERLVHRVAALDREVAARMTELEAAPAVVACRGSGLLWGVEMVSGEVAGRLIDGALAEGILLLASGPDGSVIELVPPFVVTEAQLGRCLDILGKLVRSV